MSVIPKLMTLEEYLNYDDGTDIRYELVNGELIATPVESDLNDQITCFLFAYFLQLGVPYYRLNMKTQIAVSGNRATVRQPDLTVLSEDAASALIGARQRLITHEVPPPILVVEVVSPKQENRDYRHKRTEYAGRQIREYWIGMRSLKKSLCWSGWTDCMRSEFFRASKRSIPPSFPAST